jgi:hypothetical protein
MKQAQGIPSVCPVLSMPAVSLSQPLPNKAGFGLIAVATSLLTSLSI